MSATSRNPRPVRLSVRAIIVQDGRLLLVNAWPEGKSDLMCAPGGGVDPHSPLPDNLRREVFEETGLEIEVGAVCLVNEFHDPARDFHQVDIYFRCSVIAGNIDPGWQDPERIVTQRVWVSAAEFGAYRVKPDTVAQVAFGPADAPVIYDPLEPVVV